MPIARSKITAQGQISVPVEVRKRLGAEPGATLEWEAIGDEVVVRRAATFSTQDIHKLLFPKGPPKRLQPAELKNAIGELMRKRRARN
jgi:AbrB family looped-hinge helix DNA binding protein